MSNHSTKTQKARSLKKGCVLCTPKHILQLWKFRLPYLFMIIYIKISQTVNSRLQKYVPDNHCG